MKWLFFILILSACNHQEKEIYRFTQQLEHRSKVVIIDSGIKITEETQKYLCDGEHYDVTGTSLNDTHGHGTNIAGIIAKKVNIKTTCILIIKYYTESIANVSNEVQALNIAYKIPNVKAINFSSGGEGFYKQEKEIVEAIIKNGVYFVTAAGNKSDNLEKHCNYYPACYNFKSKYFRVVGNGKNENERTSFSNYGSIITDWRYGMNINGFGIKMSGTSQSTAILTSELINQ